MIVTTTKKDFGRRLEDYFPKKDPEKYSIPFSAPVSEITPLLGRKRKNTLPSAFVI